MSLDLSNLKQPTVFEQSKNILGMISAENVVVKKLAMAISEDPVLSATLIRYANAPLYRRRVEIRNVLNAVNLLGIKNVRLAVYVATMRSFSDMATDTHNMLWEHSFGVSALAKIIAKKTCPRQADDIELTALMHDMGSLVLSTNFPGEYDQLMKHSIEQQIPLHIVEKEMFGKTHDEILTLIADDIRLPDVTRQALSFFHEREPLSEVKTALHFHIAVVALAHHLEQSVYSVKGHPVESIPESLDTLQLYLDLTSDDLQNIIEDYEHMLNEKYAI